MKKNNQTGSAHVIIIVLLVVALLGALGFVFYQNFIAKPATPQVTTSEPVIEESKTVTEQVAFNSDIYEFDRPKDWTAETQKQKDSSNTTILITNPAKDIQTKVTISEGGLGGACDQNSPRKVRFYNVHPEKVTKLAKDTAYVVEAITDAEGGGYHYNVGLTQESGATHAAVGDSFCTVTYVGVAANLTMNNGKVEQPLVLANVTFPKVADETGKVKEMQPIKDKLQSDDYKTTVALLESLRKK